MREIIVTAEEAHGTVTTVLMPRILNGVVNAQQPTRLRTPREVMMLLATQRAGLDQTDNLLWHGWTHRYSPETMQFVFLHD